MIKHALEKGLEYNYIDNGIYVGNNQCCAPHLDDMLKKEGITVDISFEEVALDQPFGVESYIWLPVKDHEPPTEDQLAFGVSAIEGFVKRKKRMYLHCKNGHGRATVFAIAYFMKARSIGESEAEEFVRSRRPTIHLQDSQRAMLLDFEKSLSNKKISFDEFSKVDMRVATVLEAERVEGSDKLLKLKVDLGVEQRQILAGIGKVYDPAKLIGKQIAVVANLEYRKLMGLESQGMVLASGEVHNLSIIAPEKNLQPGAKIR